MRREIPVIALTLLTLLGAAVNGHSQYDCEKANPDDRYPVLFDPELTMDEMVVQGVLDYVKHSFEGTFADHIRFETRLNEGPWVSHIVTLDLKDIQIILPPSTAVRLTSEPALGEFYVLIEVPHVYSHVKIASVVNGLDCGRIGCEPWDPLTWFDECMDLIGCELENFVWEDIIEGMDFELEINSEQNHVSYVYQKGKACVTGNCRVATQTLLTYVHMEPLDITLIDDNDIGIPGWLRDIDFLGVIDNIVDGLAGLVNSALNFVLDELVGVQGLIAQEIQEELVDNATGDGVIIELYEPFAGRSGCIDHEAVRRCRLTGCSSIQPGTQPKQVLNVILYALPLVVLLVILQAGKRKK